MRIKVNKIFHHLNSDKKIIAEQGGTRSGKTYNILMWIIFVYCTQNKGKIITISRKTYPSLRSTAMRDFLEILKKYGMYDEGNHNKSNSEYTLNGNVVEFISLDSPQKIRGRKRDLLFINEANEITIEDFNQLIFRTTEKVILDYNPSDEYHFIYDKVITRSDCDFHITTYKDNPFLDQAIIDEIERLKETDETYWQIYGLGMRGISKATIFQFNEIDTIPEDADLISYGMDFGFNDPTTLVSVYKKDYSLYIREHLYRSQMTSSDILSFIKENNLSNQLIYADNARADIIEELRRAGCNVRKSFKGTILGRIDLMKRHKLYIERSSDNTIQEFRNYKWIEDKTGHLTNTPEDKNNHSIDAVGYAINSVLAKPNYGRYVMG